MGVGGRTKEKIAKRNPMTALRFQTGGRHQTSPAFLRGVCPTVCSNGNSLYTSLSRWTARDNEKSDRDRGKGKSGRDKVEINGDITEAVETEWKATETLQKQKKQSGKRRRHYKSDRDNEKSDRRNCGGEKQFREGGGERGEQ